MNKETLQNYNNRLNVNNNSLNDILEIINELPEINNQNNDNMNLFIQEEEPQIKVGIWVQSNDETIPKKLAVSSKNSDLSLNGWNDVTNNEQLPYNFYLGSTAIVGSDIYIFFNETASGVNATYKYNTLTNTYTRLKDVPFNSNRSTASVIGTNIYIFGSSVSPYNQAYKYDTLNDTYTQLANAPYQVYNASSVAYGNSIYLFGGASSGTNAYRYDIENNTYTKLSNIPQQLTAGRATIIGDNVYMFGLGSSYLYAVKYNIISGTYTQLGTVYSAARCLLVPVGNYIYVLGSSYTETDGVACYQYNTNTNTYIKLSNLPFKFGQGGGGLVGNKIYLIGSAFEGERKRVQTANVNLLEFDDDLILLKADIDSQYRTKITNSISCDFSSCQLYKDKSISNIEANVYYGDGTKWIKI